MTRILAFATVTLVLAEHDCGGPKIPAGVICSPCSETGPPAGYDCAGQIMVNRSIQNKNIPKWQRACAKLRSSKK